MPPRKETTPITKTKAPVSQWGDDRVMNMFPFGVTRTYEEKATKSTRRVWWRDEDDWEARMLDEERGVGDLVNFDMDASVDDFSKSLQEQQVFVLIGGSDKSSGPSTKFLAAMREDDRKLKELLKKDKEKKSKGGNESDDSAVGSIPDYDADASSEDEYEKLKRLDAAKRRKAKQNSKHGFFDLSDSDKEPEIQTRRRNSELKGISQGQSLSPSSIVMPKSPTKQGRRMSR